MVFKKLILVILIINFTFLFAAQRDINNFEIFQFTDAGVVNIIRPLDVENKRVTFAPNVEITNFSNEPKDIPVRAEIWTASTPPSLVYSNEIVVEDVEPDQTVIVTFADWYPEDHGQYLFKAKTMLEGDEVPDNDELSKLFEVKIIPLILISPAQDTIFATNYITFQWHKVPGVETYRIQVAYDPEFTWLKVNVTTSDSFYKRALMVGRYYWRVRAEAPGTPDPWSETRNFNIVFGSGWFRLMEVPQLTRPVGSGASLCFLNNKIYTLVGNNTKELMVYDIENDSWVGVETVPPSVRARTYKTIKRGAALCTDGRYIYVIKGGNTKEFWRYDPEEDAWREFDTLPFPRGVRGGSMAFDGDSFIYIISGANDNKWIRFNRYTETYALCSPRNLPGEKWKIGSWIVYVPEDTAIYALRVGVSKKNEFWKIPIDGIPEEKESMPIFGPERKRRYAKEGSSGVYNPDDKLIYALKGGGSKDFFYYNPDSNKWYNIDTTPKKIKAGGAITYSNSPVMKGFYILIGGKSNEFWLYRPPTSPFTNVQSFKNNQIQAEIKNLNNFTLQINRIKDYLKVSYTLPVNVKATLKIYDALGNLIYNATTDKGYFTIDTKKFATGIYIMRFNANEYKATRKLVIH